MLGLPSHLGGLSAGGHKTLDPIRDGLDFRWESAVRGGEEGGHGGEETAALHFALLSTVFCHYHLVCWRGEQQP